MGGSGAERADGEGTNASSAELDALVLAYAEARERGESVDALRFATEHPRGGDALLRILLEYERTEALFLDRDDASHADLPARIGSYAVLGELGRGGMGRVLRVRREGEEEVRALKLLHDSLQHQPRALERFRREGEALERVRHPGVVRLFETGLDAGRPFLVMQLVEGRSLAAVLARSRREGAQALELPGEGSPAVRAARLVARVARAMAAAHSEGVLHRDLNPKNIVLCDDDQPVVVDFGLVHAEGSETLTVTGDVVGTPAYMAPEQALGRRVDGRADVFGLGAILFELLTLQPPRRAEDTFALLREAGTRPIVDPRRVADGIPLELARIVHRATGFEPGWRYATPGELAFDLEAFVDGRSLSVERASLRRRARELWMLRRRRVLASGALLALALVVGVYWAGGGFRSRAPTEEELSEVRNAMLVAWLEDDLAAARIEFERLNRLAPAERMLPFYDAMVHGALLSRSEDPMVQAVIDGEIHRRAGRPLEAVALYDIAWKFEPGTVLLPVLSGLAKLDAGLPAEASELFEAVIMRLFASKTLHLRLSEAFEESGGRTSDVVLARETAKAIDGTDARVAFELARAYLDDGELEKARAEAARALALDRAAVESLLAERLERPGEAGGGAQAAALRALFTD